MRCRTSSRRWQTHSWPMAHSGRTMIAGFPWFTDWGRDTFIALRGLLLATGRLAEAASILADGPGTVSEGMLPNRRPDAATRWNTTRSTPRCGSWSRSTTSCGRRPRRATPYARARGCTGRRGDPRRLHARARATASASPMDGLLRAGEPGVQLTWMDAKVGDWVVTPRIGKPVEVQALWINALRIAQRWSRAGRRLSTRRRAAFRRALLESGERRAVRRGRRRPSGRGKTDARIRPNQIFAVGGLPYPVLDGARRAAVVDLVEAKLLTPLGLRSLAPRRSRLCAAIPRRARERDAAYHQGTVWPWLLGPFVEAWLRVRGNSAAAKSEARARFLPPLLAAPRDGGLGHVSEIADGDPPHTPGGCPFQAWSLGELMRVRRLARRRVHLQYRCEMNMR